MAMTPPIYLLHLIKSSMKQNCPERLLRLDIILQMEMIEFGFDRKGQAGQDKTRQVRTGLD